ncbi:MAG: YfhO family protein [Lachnospiraceae bacterium]|nr:YfhO family protein [Lachnospiraceae bacterium]
MKDKVHKLLCDDRYNFLWAFLLTVGTMFLAMSYAQIVPWGKYYFFCGDLYVQYATFGSLLAEKIKEGSNLFYSAHIGLGANTALVWAFYCFSPIDIIYLFVDDLPIATQLVIMIKAGLMAMFFQIFCRYNLKCNQRHTIFFSMCYGLCAFQMQVSFMSSLTEGMYFLPLVLILIKYMLEKKRVTPLIVVYAAVFVANFYCGFIVGLASFAYLLVHLFLERGKQYNKKELAGIFVRYFLGVAVAFLIAAVILVPAVHYVIGMDEGGFEEFSARQAVLPELIMALFSLRKYELLQYIPYLYCGLLVLLVLPFYFTNSHFPKKERWCVAGVLLFLTCCFCVPGLYRALHMFNDPDGYAARFAYVFVFIILAAGAREFSYFREISGKKIVITAGIWWLLLVACTVLERVLPLPYRMDYTWKELLYNAILLGGWCVVLCALYKKKKEGVTLVIGVLLVAELCISMVCFYRGNVFREIEEYDTSREQNETLVEWMEAYDEGWYRINMKWEINKNNPVEYQYYGVPYFTSAFSYELYRALYHLGYQSVGLSCVDIGQTEPAEMLLGLKYTAYPAVPGNGVEEAYFTENDYVLGLGYMVCDSAEDIVFEEINAFQNQNILFSSFLNEPVELYEIYHGGVEITGENAEISLETSEEGDSIIIRRVDDEIHPTAALFHIPYDEQREAYAVFSDGNNKMLIEGPMVRTAYANEENNSYLSLLASPHIVSMELSEDGDSYVVYVVLHDQTISEWNVEEMFFAYYNREVLGEIHENLSTNQFVTEVYEDGYVRGRVTATEEKPLLFLSVPMEDGWKLYVDGKEQEIIPLVEGAFIGARLSPGEHEIELVFEAPGSRAGMYCSLAGAVLWCVILGTEIVETKKRKRGSH